MPHGTAASEITKTDIRAAARLALPHRRRRNPFDAPGLDEDLLDQLLDDEPDPDPTPPDGSPPTNGHSASSGHNGTRPETGDGASTSSAHNDRQPDSSKPFDKLWHALTDLSTASATKIGSSLPADTYRTRLFTARGIGVGEAGRRSRALTSSWAYGRRAPGQSRQAVGCTSQQPSARLHRSRQTAAASRTSRSGWPLRTCAWS